MPLGKDGENLEIRRLIANKKVLQTQRKQLSGLWRAGDSN